MISKGRSGNTIRAYKADLNGLLDDMGPCDAATFEVHAGMYLNKIRGEVSPKTLRRKLGTFRGFGEFLGVVNCLADYKAPTPPRAVPTPISGGVEAMDKMYDYALAFENKELAALVALCGFEGLRIHEALACRTKDFDFKNMRLTVHGKGDKTRIIPLFPSAFDRIAPAFTSALQRPDGRLVTYSDRGARAAIKRIARKSLKEDASSHQLRSTFATETHRRSKNLRITQELLGHASSQTTEIYTHVSMDEMRESGDLLE